MDFEDFLPAASALGSAVISNIGASDRNEAQINAAREAAFFQSEFCS